LVRKMWNLEIFKLEMMVTGNDGDGACNGESNKEVRRIN
jgi:hypothetical protein